MELQENEYQIGGISINEIAQKYETPLYVYDAEQMQLQYSKLLSFNLVPARLVPDKSVFDKLTPDKSIPGPIK